MYSSLVPGSVLLGIWQLWMLVNIVLLLVTDDTMVQCCQDWQQYAGRDASKLRLLHFHIIMKCVFVLQVAILPSSTGSVGGSLGSVWRSLQQVRCAIFRFNLVKRMLL